MMGNYRWIIELSQFINLHTVRLGELLGEATDRCMKRMVINDVVIFICMRASVHVTPSIIDAVQLEGNDDPKVSRRGFFFSQSEGNLIVLFMTAFCWQVSDIKGLSFFMSHRKLLFLP